jgi:hypothetical protein
VPFDVSGGDRRAPLVTDTLLQIGACSGNCPPFIAFSACKSDALRHVRDAAALALTASTAIPW